MLVALGFAGSRIWGGNPAATPIVDAAGPSIQDTPAAPSSSEAPQKLAERIASPDRERKPVPERVIQASQSETDDVVTRRLVSPGSAPKPAVSDPTPAPEVAVVADSVAPDLGILAPALPTLQHPVSQGVTPLVLQQKVTPRYPQEAKVIGVEGTVVLQAQVTETGRIQHLKTVSGNPMLARAAMNAVRQWRYQPATLNGKPIAMETKIAVTFKLP
jgi:TonB family protein